MRKVIIAVLAPMLLLVSACAGLAALPGIVSTISNVASTISAVGDKVEIRGTQALILAEEFYQPVNRAALTAVRSGRLTREQLLWLQKTNTEILALFERGKRASDDGLKATIAAEALQKAFQIRSLVQ